MSPFARPLSTRTRFAIAAIAGICLAGAFPKTSFMGLAWIAPALMLFAATGTCGGAAFRVGYVGGLVFHLGTLHWLINIPVRGFPILGWFLLSAFLALYQGTWVWMVSTVRRQASVESSWISRSSGALFGAAAWVAIEMVQSRLLSGFPWNLVGITQYQLSPLTQIASITGVYGVSFILVWFSLSLLEAARVLMERPASRYAWLAEIVLPMLVVLGLCVFGMARIRTARDDERPTIRVTFIQPSIPQTMIWNEAEDDERFQKLLQLTALALTNETDLVLWPEAAVPKKIRYHDEMLQSIAALARLNHVWMILGSDDAEPAKHPQNSNDADYFNSSFLISPDGELVARYNKRNLVIFGEYIPLVRWLPFLTWFVPGSADAIGFTAGDCVVPFQFERRPSIPLDDAVANKQADGELRAPIRTATLICFEDVFPHLVPEYVSDDTDFLVNLTNDGWFGEGSEQWQHAAAASFRAIENNIPLLRCCNNGLTCWIDSRGRFRQIFRSDKGSVYDAGVMTAQVPVLSPDEKRAPTFYNRHGDWFGWACVAITTLVCLFRAKFLRRGQTNAA